MPVGTRFECRLSETDTCRLSANLDRQHLQRELPGTMGKKSHLIILLPHSGARQIQSTYSAIIELSRHFDTYCQLKRVNTAQ